MTDNSATPVTGSTLTGTAVTSNVATDSAGTGVAASSAMTRNDVTGSAAADSPPTDSAATGSAGTGSAGTGSAGTGSAISASAVSGSAVSGGSGGGLRSGQVAAAAGVNLQTLRYYERRGLLQEPDRTPGGHRLYPAEAVTLLRVIKTAQRLGFTLDEVGELLEAAAHRHRPSGDELPATGLAERAAAKLAEVEAKIADLGIIADTLRQALAAGCDDLVACAAEQDCPLPFAGLAGDPGTAGAGPKRAAEPAEDPR
ncbi:MerR family transcriptional regulator [Spirillospora sp. NPDC048911]|uniref:MerR family transcriptional regulator n=1 Tax=Spirillospora sp. NPDC048911 TaxID=3364527 RepID=UPI003719A222